MLFILQSILVLFHVRIYRSNLFFFMDVLYFIVGIYCDLSKTSVDGLVVSHLCMAAKVSIDIILLRPCKNRMFLIILFSKNLLFMFRKCSLMFCDLPFY